MDFLDELLFAIVFFPFMGVCLAVILYLFFWSPRPAMEKRSLPTRALVGCLNGFVYFIVVFVLLAQFVWYGLIWASQAVGLAWPWMDHWLCLVLIGVVALAFGLMEMKRCILRGHGSQDESSVAPETSDATKPVTVTTRKRRAWWLRVTLIVLGSFFVFFALCCVVSREPAGWFWIPAEGCWRFHEARWRVFKTLPDALVVFIFWPFLAGCVAYALLKFGSEPPANKEDSAEDTSGHSDSKPS